MTVRFSLHAGFVIACASLLIPQAYADFDDHPLPDHSSALSNYRGTTRWSLAGTLAGGQQRHLDVNVDYAVFQPGSYPRDLSNFLPYSSFIQTFEQPSPDDYLYAFQIYNNGLPQDPTADSLFFLSVGLGSRSLAESRKLVHSLGRDLGFDPGGLDATLAVLGSDGAKYFMIFGLQGSELRPHQFSTVFLLASPNAPHMGSSYIFSTSGLSSDRDINGDVALLPSPIPTPAAGLAGALGLISLAAWKLRRRT